jgi:SAM-dependent methyltransferase
VNSFLHVGCGPKRQDRTTQGFNKPDWREVRLDINPAVNPDIVGSMTDMSAVESESMDAIFSSHNLEHLYVHEIPPALAEFRRVLRPTGFIVVTCPDLKSVCALVAQDKLLDPAYQSPAGPIAPIDILYGHRAAMARGDLFMAHRSGFTESVMVHALRGGGFASVASVTIPQRFELWAVATVQDLGESSLRALVAEHFPRR